jgi:hypothetical protein
MVPIVISFSVSNNRHEVVVSRLNFRIPFSASEHMAKRVHTPRAIQSVAVEKH